MKKTIVILAVEEALERMGEPVLEQVYSKLYSKHRCYLTDCYEKPEYLNDVLKDVFGGSYKTIIESIEENLEDFASEEPIKEFLAIIKST